ncbi:hypothetical protein [Dactylosporangium sp. NPDC049140]|jgi:hypothetical protein|uniref:hypothetical protein n=1 Tax=Dactylosporangium sp. NPDC049140 TaxID=3155647 RepID=UPI0033EF2B72
MRVRRTIGAATAVAAGVLAALGTAAQAAREPAEGLSALPRIAPCATVRRGNTEGILTTSSGANPNSTAVVKVQREGVEATLPDAGP